MEQETNRIIKTEITRILIELGIPINLQGFNYLKESIYLVVNTPNVINKVTKELYPTVGNFFNVAGSVVERAMRHSAEIGFEKTNFDPLKQYFNITDSYLIRYKPTNSELIALIAEYIKNKFYLDLQEA